MLIAIRSSLESIKIIKFNRFESIEVSFDLEMCHYGQNLFTFAITNRAFILFFRGECCTNFYRKDGKCIGGLRNFFTILPKRILIVMRLYLYIYRVMHIE